MTRGAAVDGPWDLDAVASSPADHVRRLAQDPQLRAPGMEFVYDNGVPHLLSAAATKLLGESVADFAGRELFAPLGIVDYEWPTDPVPGRGRTVCSSLPGTSPLGVSCGWMVVG
jgi:CubicO group peptidase (beta-lactamase class C family)